MNVIFCCFVHLVHLDLQSNQDASGLRGARFRCAAGSSQDSSAECARNQGECSGTVTRVLIQICEFPFCVPHHALNNTFDSRLFLRQALSVDLENLEGRRATHDSMLKQCQERHFTLSHRLLKVCFRCCFQLLIDRQLCTWIYITHHHLQPCHARS